VSGLLPIDACILINLYATTRTPEILRALSVQVVVVEQVASEALYVMRSIKGELVRTQIDITPEVRQGLIIRAGLIEEELADYVRHAAELDDGEAATVALAEHRASAIATDDRAAINYVTRNQLPLTVFRTSDLIRRWMDSARISPAEVSVALAEIRDCGRFVPNDLDPHADWWRTLVGNE